jgi:drug/metabolite transporter (DMT)-like permease
MNEQAGVVIAILSSALGGTAAAVTRYLVSSADPITLAICAGVSGSCASCP